MIKVDNLVMGTIIRIVWVSLSVLKIENLGKIRKIDAVSEASSNR